MCASFLAVARIRADHRSKGHLFKGEDIYRSDADGNGETLVIRAGGPVRQIRIDSETSQIYWSVVDDNRLGTIKKASLVGSAEQTLVGSAAEGVFDLDRDANEIYFFRREGIPSEARLMQRNLTTVTEATIFVGDRLLALALTIDPVERYAYLGTGIEGSLFRVEIDEDPPSSSSLPAADRSEFSSDLGIDTIRHLIYYTTDAGLVRGVQRIDTTTAETEDFGFSLGDIGGITAVHPHPGTDTIYFSAYSSSENRLYKADFTGGAAQLVIEGNHHSAFALDIVDPTMVDSEAPDVTILNPLDGTTNVRDFSLTGLVTENLNLVAKTTWEWNGVDQGILSLLEDGSFATTELQLAAGLNTLRVVAEDIDGNVSEATVTTTWVPDRRLSLGDSQTVSEGDVLTIPVTLNSQGNIGGIAFTIDYDPRYLQVQELSVATTFTVESNLATPGNVIATIARPGGSFPSGEQVPASLTFRVRSVPDSTTSLLDLTVQGVSDSQGALLPIGNVVDANVTILPRQHEADANTNDRLDVGDAFLMWRLLLGHEEIRDWDHVLNDLNGNMSLDIGDLILLLDSILAHAIPPDDCIDFAESTIVEPDGPRLWLSMNPQSPLPGDLVDVSIHLEASDSLLSGLSFVLDYPADALRLESSSSHRAGSLVAGSTIWNVAPSIDDYVNQSGRVTFVATGATPWPNSDQGGRSLACNSECKMLLC